MSDDFDPNGVLAGAAHDAAWSTVRLRPPEGWRNSYDERYEPDMAAAHSAAHTAMLVEDIAGEWNGPLPSSPACWAARNAIQRARRESDRTSYLDRIPLTSDGKPATEVEQ